MKEQFLAFLEANDALEQYNDNCAHAADLDPEDPECWHGGNLDDVDPGDYLMDAFYWEPSDEGHGFWSNLDDKWMETLEA